MQVILYLQEEQMKGKLLITLTGLLVVFILAGCAAPVGAPAANSPRDGLRTLNVQGTGEVLLTPDIAYVSIGIESRAEQVTAALNENNNQAARIAETLRELGVDERDIQTSAFNVFPMQEYSPMGELMGTVYVVNNTVNITVRNLQSLGELLDSVVRAGANNIHSIQFDVDNKEVAVKEARRLAIANARQNALELADAAGVQLGELVTLNVYSNGSAAPLFDGKMFGGLGSASSNVPIAAGQLMITMIADLSYEIK
jgi:uncharacterized protein